MAERLNDSMVRQLETPAQGNRITYDETVRGFGVRMTAGGAKSFILNYRVRGRERRYTIGAYPDWTTSAARNEAKELKRAISKGDDPLGARQQERAAPTVNDLCDRYIKEHLPKKRPASKRHDEGYIKRIVRPKLGRLKVADVRYADIDGLHQALKDTPVAANRLVTLLSKMFSLAIRWDWRETNPCKEIERYDEQERQRYLTTAEIARLTDALAQHDDQVAANVIRLILFTGARRGEVLNATWDQFNLGAGVWIKPSAHTKQKREHRVPLSAPAIELLSNLKKAADGEYVFPGRVPGQPRTELKRTWEALCKTAKIENARVHDLRHTFASILVSSGMSLVLVGRLLGHTQAQTTLRYGHIHDDPLREATERVGKVVTNAGKKSAEVVPLRG